MIYLLTLMFMFTGEFSTKGVRTNVQRKVNDYEVFVWSRESSIVTYVSGLAL